MSLERIPLCDWLGASVVQLTGALVVFQFIQCLSQSAAMAASVILLVAYYAAVKHLS